MSWCLYHFGNLLIVAVQLIVDLMCNSFIHIHTLFLWAISYRVCPHYAQSSYYIRSHIECDGVGGVCCLSTIREEELLVSRWNLTFIQCHRLLQKVCSYWGPRHLLEFRIMVAISPGILKSHLEFLESWLESRWDFRISKSGGPLSLYNIQ